ncbi:MAG: hypothetical protein RLZZ630_2229, partial [Bacteroidota bacterium]
MKCVRGLLLISALLTGNVLSAQDSLYTRRILDDLTSRRMHGRGYVKNGCNKAGKYLEKEFRKIGLQPLEGKEYRQHFELPINVFPGHPSLEIDGRTLSPGVDFLVAPGSPPASGVYDIVTVRSPLDVLDMVAMKGKWLFLDTIGSGVNFSKEDLKRWKNNLKDVAGILYAEPKKLTWSVSRSRNTTPELTVLQSSLDKNPTKVRVKVNSELIEEYSVFNVIGTIPGSINSDTTLYVTAHYDHLGGLGPKTRFPGANDNASGVSMLLNIAMHFMKPEYRPRHRMVFIAFAAEEAGLVGSKHYTEQPWTPLSKIKFLLNLDLMGTGEDGMMVVNATEHPVQFQELDSLNTISGGLKEIRQRGKAANSDHYWFSENGVPA